MTMTAASKHKRYSANFEFSAESLRQIQQDDHEATRACSDHNINSPMALPVTSIEFHPTMIQRSFSELHVDDDDDQDIFYTLENNDVDSFVFLSFDDDDDDKDDSVHPLSPTSVIAEPALEDEDDWMHEWKNAPAITVVPTKSVLPTDPPSRVVVPSTSTSRNTTTTPSSPCATYLPQPSLVPLNARFCAYVAWSMSSSSSSSSGSLMPTNRHLEIGLVQIVETHYPGGFVLECHRDERDSSVVSLPLQRHYRAQRHEHGVDICDGNQRLLRLIVVPLTPQGLLLTATTTRDDPVVIDAVICLWFCLESYIRQSPTAASS